MPVSDLLEGDPKQIGPYPVLSRLGTGGMGIVYLVRAGSGLGALKMIRPELASEPEFSARFRREIETSRSVTGPFVARVIDASLEETAPYLVTEYIEGPPLAEVVSRSGPLAFGQVQRLGRGLAQGLRSIHVAGIVHRDLKPSNVILSPSGPKIIDFGIARVIEERSLTMTGSMVGSPQWMSPEAASGKMPTPASDVFSWGSVMTFAALGRSPFGEGRPEAVLYRVVHEAPDLDGLDPRLLTLIARALDHDPPGRPTLDELIALTSRSAWGLDPNATRLIDRPSPSPAATQVNLALPLRPTKPPRRRRRIVAVVAGSVVALAALVGIIAAIDSAVGGGSNGSPTAPRTSSTSTPVSTTTSTTVAPPPTTSTPVTAPGSQGHGHKVGK